MQVGASYYPEVIPPSEWERDLATGREIGLSCLRCGEFAWSAFSPEENTWQQEWALEFLALAQQYGYEVIWCTPSATPPPYLFDRWPDLHAVSVDGDEMPVGVRRHYCPSHSGYQEQCTEVAGHLAQAFTGAPAIKGWQVDNEIAGDGFTCWCPRCQQAFQDWLHSHYGSLEQLNEAWQTGVWSQRYTDWRQIPIPHKRFTGHTPALKFDYRRFRSDNWLAFYRKQYDVLKRARAQRVSTNFYNVTWDIPFNQWAWRPYLDAVGVSHYLEGEIESHFQLALLQGAMPGEKPLWVLEQKAGQQNAQNFYPDDLARLERHLRICAEHGAEYAIYWHLRQHSAGCEMEHGAVLRHDGKPTRIARAIQQAIESIKEVAPCKPSAKALLVFSFEQQWANENRPQPGTRWDYRLMLEQQWFAGALDTLGPIKIGDFSHISDQKLVVAPFAQMMLPGILESLQACFDAGGTVVTTADFVRLDANNNVLRQPPLGALASLITVPELEMLHLREGYAVAGAIGHNEVQGTIFWAVPDGQSSGEGIGHLQNDEYSGPVALRFPVRNGSLIIALTALDRHGVEALLNAIR